MPKHYLHFKWMKFQVFHCSFFFSLCIVFVYAFVFVIGFGMEIPGEIKMSWWCQVQRQCLCLRLSIDWSSRANRWAQATAYVIIVDNCTPKETFPYTHIYVCVFVLARQQTNLLVSYLHKSVCTVQCADPISSCGPPCYYRPPTKKLNWPKKNISTHFLHSVGLVGEEAY